MDTEYSRRRVLWTLACLPAFPLLTAMTQSRRGGTGQGRGGKQRKEGYSLPENLADYAATSIVLGRVTDKSVVVSAMSSEQAEAYIEWGPASGHYTDKTPVFKLQPGQPAETMLGGLKPGTEHFYRLHKRANTTDAFVARPECRFHTQRAPGQTFSFAIQGDSHPERAFMSDPALYVRTLQQAAALSPDFYICMGDDFSISTLQSITAESVDSRYTLQRPFLGLVGRNAPVFLVNGNHEQASLYNYNQTDERHQAAVFAQKARNLYFPTVAPDHFYTGNEKPLDGIGALKDYYAWTWGDALFVVLDNYWHSTAQVDSGLHDKGGGANPDGGGRQRRDMWEVTLGEDQYKWFKKTLEESKAKYKFVFAHHVLGTQRGGVEVSHLYEWGGHDPRGVDRFKELRPGWAMPVHDLMVKHKVTVFFQGHDHLYCQQERDGVVYQEVPVPADPEYQTYNADRYTSGTKLPNSGHLHVTVSPEGVTVDYIRSYLPAHETADRKSGEKGRSYTIKART